MKANSSLLFLLLFSLNAYSIARLNINDSIENKTPESTKKEFRKKGSLFFYWGYNRAGYTKSDIHFYGTGYDFEIFDAAATDDPTTTFSTYINPTSLSVPQYNYRLGYFINEKIFFSIGTDHMKYQLKKQVVKITGTISEGENAGVYNNNNNEIIIGEISHSHGSSGEHSHSHDHFPDSLKDGFVSTFEHCDGLNEIGMELGRSEILWMARNNKHAISAIGTMGTGMMAPDTEANILGVKDKSHSIGGWGYHLAGLSINAGFGIQLDLFRYYFIQTKIKGGYVNLFDINSTIEGGKAKQQFGFFEPIAVIGFSYPFGK